MSDKKQELNLDSLLQMDEMSEVQREVFLEKVGGIIIEASVGKLLMSLEVEKADELEKYLKTILPDEDVFAFLLRKYPDFQSIVEGEIAALKEQFVESLG